MTMNVALIAVIVLFAATIVGALLKPTEAEVNAANAPAAPEADSHGHGAHGHH